MLGEHKTNNLKKTKNIDFVDKNFSFSDSKKVISILFQYFVIFYKQNNDINNFKNFILNENYNNKQIDISFKIVDNIFELIDEISKKIFNWKFKRLGSYEKAILVFGTYYLLYEKKISKKIIIWFCTQNAKNYCEEKAYKLINAILDKIN